MNRLGPRSRTAIWVASASLLTIATAAPAFAQDDAQGATAAQPTTTAQADAVQDTSGQAEQEILLNL